MSDNKFTESMEVIEIGTMRLCDSVPVCANFTDVTGVLIEGITKDAEKLLYEKVEIVAEGTKAKMEEMTAANRNMRSQIKELQREVLEFFDSTNATVIAGRKICITYAHLKNRVAELEASNKQLREIICEFAHYLACPAYVFRPETVKTIIDIAAEGRAGR